MLDACTQALGALLGAGVSADGLFLPLHYERLELAAPVPSRFFCHLWRRRTRPTASSAKAYTERAKPS